MSAVSGAASTLRSTPLRRAALAAALWAAAVAAAGADALPDGFATLRFGSSVAQATAALPALRPMAPQTPGTGAAGLPMAYYRAEDQAFDGLRPCTALLGFVADRFYEVRLDCGHDARIASVLRQRFGAPAQEDQQFTTWQDEKRSASLNRATMGFSFADRALTEAAHQLIIQRMLSAGAAAAPANTPGR